MTIPTSGAFGKQNNPLAPKSKKRKLMVRKYMPPPEVQHRIMEKDKQRESSNKFVRFIKKLFGEGF